MAKSLVLAMASAAASPGRDLDPVFLRIGHTRYDKICHKCHKLLLVVGGTAMSATYSIWQPKFRFGRIWPWMRNRDFRLFGVPLQPEWRGRRVKRQEWLKLTQKTEAT
ncbi:hypothetical protein MKX08_006645 [Trichoderma sp. CBMAI-0020]|nr:hypothetical protein MKX08_006645 [Trichoderma sp. CBMAI-0020]